MDAENAPKFKCLETLANCKVKHYAISTVNYIITITQIIDKSLNDSNLFTKI